MLATIGVRFMLRSSSLPKVAALTGLCCRAFLAFYKLSTQLDDQDRCSSTTFAGRLLKIVTRPRFSTSYSDWLISDSCCSRFLPQRVGDLLSTDLNAQREVTAAQLPPFCLSWSLSKAEVSVPCPSLEFFALSSFILSPYSHFTPLFLFLWRASFHCD